MQENDKERYVRWQDHRVAQLSFSINLFLGFSVASLAYIINLKLSGNESNLPINLVMMLWAISALLGCMATISRLLDYRYTARKIKSGGKFNVFMAKHCGPVTWGCFWSQVIAYTTGSILFISGVLNA